MSLFINLALFIRWWPHYRGAVRLPVMVVPRQYDARSGAECGLCKLYLNNGSQQEPWRCFGNGVAVSGLNPKALLFFVAFLPPFTSLNYQWGMVEQIMVLGSIHTASCAVVYTGVGYAAKWLLGSRPAAVIWVSRIAGVTMMCLAIGLLVH